MKPGLKEADRLFSLIIRKRDQLCQMCGNPYQLQCAHLISRRYARLRHDEANAIALCVGCHKKFTHRPLEWDEWCAKRMGAGVWASMKVRAQESSPVRKNYRVICAELRARLIQLEEVA